MKENSGDITRILIAAALRNFAFGLLSVGIGVALAQAGLALVWIGAVFTVALLAAGILSGSSGRIAHRFGRRRTLLILASAMAAGCLLLSTGSLVLVLVAALFATFSPSGKDVGPMLPLEVASLAEVLPSARRTHVYSRYNMLAALLSALGALAAAYLPAGRVAAMVAGGIGLVLLVPYAGLSPSVEPQHAQATKSPAGLQRSRKRVFQLTALFGVDALAGGFVVQGIAAVWLHARFGAPLLWIGPLFFLTNLGSALSLLAAPWLARKIGLLSTMVFTHLPSNVLLLLVAFAPNFPIAAALLIARGLLSQLDVPTRQAYTMALVDPAERTAAAGVTASVRGTAQAVSPLLTGIAMGMAAYGLPFALAGGMKALYDLALYFVFRRVPLAEPERS
ncbi:MAG: MFS transporter [Thermaerobacter sp.]|nr:MFS transporter [Thermaerobacter sp.]